MGTDLYSTESTSIQPGGTPAKAGRRRPGWLPTAVTLGLVPALVWLGLWQLDRAEEKAETRSRFERNAELPPVLLTPGLAANPEDVLYRRVRLRGTFDEGRQILLENQKHRGRPGYRVFTAMELAGSRQRILVDRGWIPQDPGRRRAPDPPVPAGAVNMRGRAGTPPSVGMRLGPPASTDSWPRPVVYLDLAWAERELGVRLLPFIVVQTAATPGDGLVRRWDPVPAGQRRMPPERHVSYAVQWFALAAALVAIFIGVHLRRRPVTEGGEP